jgi:hypothetical protein
LVDGVGTAIDFRDAMRKQARAFAAVAHSPKFLRAADPTNQGAAEQALEIESDVRAQGFRFLQPGQQTARPVQAAKFAARKNVHMVDIRISAQQRRPLRINNPGYLRPRVGVPNRRHRRQRVHHVPERTRLDDQDGTDFRFQISDLRLEDALINLQSEIYNLKFLLAPQLQAVGEQVRQPCLDDLFLRRGEIVFYAALFDHVFFDVVNAVGGAPITIARLADAANVNEVFFRFLDGEPVHLHFLYAVIPHECSGHVRVPEEADRRLLVRETGNGIETVKDVAPLLRRIERRVDDREILDLLGQRQRAQPFLVFIRQVRARPIDRGFRQGIKAA